MNEESLRSALKEGKVLSERISTLLLLCRTQLNSKLHQSEGKTLAKKGLKDKADFLNPFLLLASFDKHKTYLSLCCDKSS
jgi:hypothetical protein